MKIALIMQTALRYLWAAAALGVWLFSSPAHATDGFHYCEGKVLEIVTRASAEGTNVRIEGMYGWAKIGFGGSAEAEMHERQFSMLLSAYVADKTVILEFYADNQMTCTSNHDNLLIRYVRLK